MKFFFAIIAISIAINIQSQYKSPYPIYTNFLCNECDNQDDPQNFDVIQSLVLFPDTIYSILWKDHNTIDNHLHLLENILLGHYNLQDSLTLINCLQQNIEILYIQSAKIEQHTESVFIISRADSYDPIFADSTIRTYPRQHDHSISVSLILPNNKDELGVKLLYLTDENYSISIEPDGESFLFRAKETKELTLHKHETSLDFIIPDNAKYIAPRFRLLNVKAQDSEGEFWGRIIIPYSKHNPIKIPKKDIVISLPSINTFAFTQPYLGQSHISIIGEQLYWKEIYPYLKGLDLYFPLLQPYIDKYRIKRSKIG